ncbi:MAG: aminotransferase class I/II-fold pyridoxal phosphate-dependent enzyme [Actinomycetota bacterium]
MPIDPFEMERMQSLYWHRVEYDLSESGVTPLRIAELLDGTALDPETFLQTELGYPLSEGSDATRAAIAAWYPGAEIANVTVVNGGSEANFLSLWTLLDRGFRLAFMVPNYMEGWGLGRFFADGTDTFSLRLSDDAGRWFLDADELAAAVTDRTRVVMVCNPNNPTGHVLTEGEMDVIVAAADRVGAWIVADEIYRGAEVETDEASPTFWGRSDRVVCTSGLSKAFGMPGLRIGWAVGPVAFINDFWAHHDYTTLTPSMVSDRLCAIAMEPVTRERILARTREIIRRQLPRLEEWILARDDVFRYARPKAGAIAYAVYDLPVRSRALIDRIREEQSVLLVPGEVFGIGDGIRFGFGYDIEHTMQGLARVDGTLDALRT